ncbi:MAG: hypothetical protein ACE5MI_10970 [Acidimicrobiia bacterium]
MRKAALVPAVILVAAACGGAPDTAQPTVTTAAMVEEALTEWADHTTETASYRILVRTGPAVELEVMMEGATMTFVDQGQPVNHHLEVHVFDKSSGAEIKDLVPTVGITDPATGTFREFAAEPHASGEIPYVTACLLTNHRVREPHFGDNLYLADGTYTVSVTVGDETAETDVSVADAQT